MNQKNEHEKHGDIANQAFFDALQFSFKILKLVMILAVLVYFINGAFQVQSDQVALKTRFGKVLGIGLDRELKEGPHWSWPWPIEGHIKVQTKKIKSTNCEFYYQQSEQEKMQGVGYTLVPGKDDYIVTADANILHVKLVINYEIIDAYAYIKSFEGADKWDPNLNPKCNPEVELINPLANAAVIQAAGQFKVDSILSSDKPRFSALVKDYLTKSIRSINCGIELRDVLISKIEPPRQVINDFSAVMGAAQKMHEEIGKAMGEYSNRLNEAAGVGYEELIAAIQKEQKLQQTKDPKLPEAQKAVSHLLDQAGGSVKEILEQSKIYRTRVVESAKADAKYMQALLPKYLENPKVVMTRLLLSVMETTLNNVRKWYMPKDVSEIRIMIDRDPVELKEISQ